MKGTETLREDHRHIMRLDAVIQDCYNALYSGTHIPASDIREITVIISEFFDAIHYIQIRRFLLHVLQFDNPVN